MSLPIKALIPVIGLISGAAQAQLLPTWETNIVLASKIST